MNRGVGTAIVVLAIAAAFVAYCLFDLARSRRIRYLPKWGWAVVICVTVPWGGLAYLFAGRERSGADPGATAPVPPAPALAPAPRPTSAPVAGPAPRAPRHPAAAAAIEVSGLTKRFGRVTAVDDLTFTVRPGQVTGFLGPNGAGKTTTMRVLLGLDSPTAGTALVGGRHYQQISRPLHTVGSLLDAAAVQGGRTAWFHLLALAQSNGIPRARVTRVLELTGLDPVAGRRIGEFSLGMRQRLGLAAALLADPPVLVLDEPVNGLDPEGIRWIRELLRAMATQGRTILVSSHLMGEMAQTADHLVIIGRGRLLADTPTADFVSATRRDVLVRSPRAGELGALLTAAGAAVQADPGGGLAVAGADAPSIGDLAAAHGIAVHELVPRHASLEQAYLDLTGGATDYQAAAAAIAPAPERTATP